MKFKIIINYIIITATVVFLVILAFRTKVGATANSIAVLKTDGMTCGSCSSKITKALESLKGVAVTEVDLNGGWVVVGYDTKNVSPENLAEKVTESGFNCNVQQVLTPEQFKRLTGRDIGAKTAATSGCCGSKGGGCGSAEKN